MCASGHAYMHKCMSERMYINFYLARNTQCINPLVKGGSTLSFLVLKRTKEILCASGHAYMHKCMYRNFYLAGNTHCMHPLAKGGSTISFLVLKRTKEKG